MTSWEKFKHTEPGKAQNFQVRVHVIECRELQPRDSNGLSDPVVFVKIAGRKNNTIVHKKTTSCTFDHLMFFEFQMLAEEFFRSKVNVVVFDANTIRRNVEIGSYDFDVASVYENPQHEIFRTWVALTDSTGTFKGIQGYLKLSVTVLGPNDVPPTHEDEDEDTGEEDENSVDLQSLVLLPPSIQTEQYSLDITVCRAENLPKMDTFGKVDPYVAVKFGNSPEIQTEVIKKKFNPIWNETLCIPFTLPTMAEAIKVQLRDWDLDKRDEVVGTVFFKLSELLVPLKPQSGNLKSSSENVNNLDTPQSAIEWANGKWVNLYGVPNGIRTNALSSHAPIAKKMNNGFMEGTAWRGRVLVAMSTRRVQDPKLIKNKASAISDPPTASYTLRFDVYEAAEVNSTHDIRVRISIGSHIAKSAKAKVTNGSASWFKSLDEITFAGPKDVNQLPDIFIDVRTRPTVGVGKRIGFIRLKPSTLVVEGKPVWEVLTTDIFFADADANQIAGMLQYSVCFGETRHFGIRPPLEKPQMRKYQLRAHMYQGRDLPAGDSNGASDPYCTIKMGRWSAKTKVVKNTCFPLWYETVSFDVELPQNRNIASDVNIKVWDWDLIGGDDYLGRFSVKAQNITSQFQSTPTWYPIFRSSPSSPEGEILASFQLIPIEDVSKYPPFPITPKFKECTLEISVVGLRDILPVHLLPVTNAFIEFNCGSDKRVRTKTSDKPKPNSPNFLETLEMPVLIPENPIFAPAINIRVFDDRKILRPLAALRTISLEPFVPWYNASQKNLDEGYTPVVEQVPGASLIKEEPPAPVPHREIVVDTSQEEPSERSSLLGQHTPQEEKLGTIPEDKRRMLLKALSSRSTAEPAETIPEGLNQEDLEDIKKPERPLLKHELETDLITQPTFLTLKLYRAKHREGKKVKIEVGEFKGQFRIIADRKAPPPLDLVEMFKQNALMVRIYILECFQLVPTDADGYNNPYIRITNGVEKIKDVNSRKQNTSRPQIFKCYEMPCTFPDQTFVEIAVWDWDPVPPHDLIGTTRIDLENRYHSREWQMQERKPMEYRTLWHPSSSNAQGQIKLWVDILTVEEARNCPPENIAPPAPKECELRVIVWDTKEVVFKDDKMSDIFVSCYPEGSKPQFTDVHWRSEDHSGEFNWRMKFPIVLPISTPRLKVQIWDKDVTNPDDAIGEAVLNLRAFFKKFFDGKSDREVLPKQYITLTKTGTQGIQGKVQLTIEIMTKEEALRRPAGLGRGEPNMNPFLDKPKRPETSFGWWRMDKMGKLVAGRFWRAHRWKFLVCCIVIVLVLGVVAFLYLRTVLPSLN